ncbi:MAG: hypothetical protein WDZ86_07815 [Gammaproteobacteria bacterium]
MNSRLTVITLFAILLAFGSSNAFAVRLTDYKLLRTGMSEAEVYYRIGEFDRESVFDGGFYGGFSKKIWYYMPSPGNPWLTEITFDHNGQVRELRRYKP